MLDAGLIRYAHAPRMEVFEALLNRAELKGRLGMDAAPDLADAGAPGPPSTNSAQRQIEHGPSWLGRRA